jgi:hypothetical protein
MKLYETVLSEYIESLDVSVNEFYRELAEIKDDPNIKDKKLLHFVNYLIASTDYESFYKIMGRVAKKARKAEDQLDDRAESKTSEQPRTPGSKAEGKASSEDRDSKYAHK